MPPSIQGAQDKLVNPDGATFLYQSVSSEDKKLFVVEGAFHNLFVELDEVKIPAIKTTVDWILEHVWVSKLINTDWKTRMGGVWDK